MKLSRLEWLFSIIIFFAAVITSSILSELFHSAALRILPIAVLWFVWYCSRLKDLCVNESAVEEEEEEEGEEEESLRERLEFLAALSIIAALFGSAYEVLDATAGWSTKLLLMYAFGITGA